MDQDEVWKALADPSRRALLDLLFERDGQSLLQLQAHLPMTRFGVMKHLRVLEGAGLVSTRKVGRERRHYLNPVPIQLAYDRWVSKYARPWARALTGLKHALEDTRMAPSHVFEVWIRTTPERLWQALTDGELTEQYYYGSRAESAWQPGAAYRYADPTGSTIIDGEVLEAVPPRRLVMTFRPLFAPGADSREPTRTTWEIEPQGDVCKLTLVHEGLAASDPTAQSITSGWNQILSGLKTLLETGQPLAIPA